MPRPFHDLRVFTSEGEGGNPLAVVLGPLDLGHDQMLEGAVEVGYSETVYVERAADAPAAGVRIFSPARELPFAGHPLVGTAWLLNHLGPSTVDRLELEMGPVGCGADESSAWIECPLAQVDDLPDAGPYLASLGDPEISAPCRLVGLGTPYPMIELPSFEAVARVQPDHGRLARCDRGEAYIFAMKNDRAKARFFAPAFGIDEDPATGSAAVALASLLGSDGRLGPGQALAVLQGEEVGRPCRLEVALTSRGTVRLSGAVASDGTGEVSV